MMIPYSLIETIRVEKDTPRGDDLERYARWELGGYHALIDQSLSSHSKVELKGSSGGNRLEKGDPGLTSWRSLRIILGRFGRAP
jgi:hypothetical protein